MPATEITTSIDLGATIRYTQPVNRLKADGVVVGILRQNGTPWLEVSRVRDEAHVVVGLHEVVRVLQDAPPVEAAPVVEVPDIPVVTIPAVRVTVGASVRFVTASGHKAVGWVQDMDGDVLLVEREDATLELMTLDDLCPIGA